MESLRKDRGGITELDKFQKIVETKYELKFESYWEFHRWTVQNYTKFLEEMWNFFDIIYSEPYTEVLVKTGPGFLDNEWFSGAKLNYAENILCKRDDTIALICLDELGQEERVTFAEMYEEVKLYAAAFRKNGLKTGDCVACFMSNRKEAIFAMLAATSIGAIYGSALPFYGAKAASNVVRTLEPKFLIAIDRHQMDGIIFPTLDYLPEIVDNAPTLEKVILVVTQEETRKKNLSNIRSWMFLEDFLESGRSPEGGIPDIIFEQLPFDHPVCVNFTSGTTGLPKAPVHSAGSLLSLLRDAAFSCNLKSGDVLCMNYPVGWSIWDNFIPFLALGTTFFLYCGSFSYTLNGRNFWDIMAKYDVKCIAFVPSMLDKMEKMELYPSPGSDLSSLEFVEIGASPVKKQNIEYLHRIKKDVFVSIYYGSCETFGSLSGCNMNMPVYPGEIQVPSLGIDLQCFNSSGKSVVGEKGEVVICNPAINFPIGLWKDENKVKITDLYLSKFPGVWAQQDICWINPKTKGIVVIGRSDDTLKQNGERFGAGDVYFAIHSLKELQDYICVSQKKQNGDTRAVLFVKMSQGSKLTAEVKTKMEQQIEEELFDDCVPELILEVPDIPYNLNNKRVESLVRKIIETNQIPDVMNIRNPECLKHFVEIPEIIDYNKH